MTIVSSAISRSSRNVEQLAARLVEPLAHRPVLRDFQRRRLRPVLLEQPLGRVVRLVRQHRRVPEKERLAALGGMVDEVEDRLHGLAADLEAVVAVPAAACWIAVAHAVGEPAVPVVASPPFAGLKTDVPPGRKQARQRGHAVEVADQLRGEAPTRSAER